MGKYRKKPIVIEAYPIIIEAYMFAGGSMEPGFPDNWLTCEHEISSNGEEIFIESSEGKVVAQKGDWIIKDTKGAFLFCKPDIFEATYEKVDEN